MAYNGGTLNYVATINDVATKDYEVIRFDVDSMMPQDVLAKADRRHPQQHPKLGLP